MGELQLAKSVVIGECLMRDGLQNLDFFVPTNAKVWLIDALSDCGFKSIEVTAFSDPRRQPQFKDAEEVLSRIKRKPGVHYGAVAIGMKAHERLVDAAKRGLVEVPYYGMWIGVSETHARANTGRTHDQLWEQARQIAKDAEREGKKFLGSIATAFGCPIEGPQPLEKVIEWAKRYYELGARRIQIADTTGEGTPKQVYECFTELRQRWPDVNFYAHFHESRGWALANCWAALMAGCTDFDSSIGGIGGQPTNFIDREPVGGTGERYTPSDLTGNVRTEDLVVMLDECGIDTGLDIDRVLEVGRMMERICGRPLRSWTTKSGRIPKHPTEYYYKLRERWEKTPK
ncbi:MAG: hydroxymethylglutaryl-CoA lyase [Pseudomonadota bacterium]